MTPLDPDLSKPHPAELSEALLSALLHNCQSAMALSTWPEIRLLDANETWGRLTGLDPAQVKGTQLPHQELFPFPEEMATILGALRKTGEITDAPLTLRGLSGEVKHLLWSGKVVEATERTFLVSSATDITALKEARSALEASEAQFQWAFQANPDGMLLLDASRRALDLNPALEGITGYARSELLGRSGDPEDLNAWVNAQEREAFFQELLLQGQVQDFSARLRRKDQVEFQGSLSATLLKREGHPCILISLRNTSRQQRIEEALRAQEARLQLSLTGAELGAWDWEVTTGRMHCDPRWAELLGYQPGELPPAHATLWQALIHPEDRPRVLDACQRHLNGESPSYACEFRIRHRRGDWIWVLDRGRVVARNLEGQALRVCGALQDISARKAMEAECHAANAQLQALLAALPDLLFVFSREGRFLSCHAPAGTLMMAPEAFLGHLVEEVLPAELAAQTRATVGKACLEGEVQEFTYALEMPQGLRHFHTRIARISEDQAVALTREIPAP